MKRPRSTFLGLTAVLFLAAAFVANCSDSETASTEPPATASTVARQAAAQPPTTQAAPATHVPTTAATPATTTATTAVTVTTTTSLPEAAGLSSRTHPWGEGAEIGGVYGHVDKPVESTAAPRSEGTKSVVANVTISSRPGGSWLAYDQEGNRYSPLSVPWEQTASSVGPYIGPMIFSVPSGATVTRIVWNWPVFDWVTVQVWEATEPADPAEVSTAVPATAHEVLWTFASGAGIMSTPAVADGVVYVVSKWMEYSADRGTLHALDAQTGRERWKLPIAGVGASSPAVADGMVYVGSNDGYVHAVDTQTGKQKWTFKVGGSEVAEPAVSNGVVYIGSDAPYLYAVDARTGRERWKCKTGGSAESSPVVAGGVVYVGSRDSCLYAIAAETGREKWRSKTGDAISCSPAVADGVVYVGSNDEYLYAIEAGTGHQRWRFDAEIGNHVFRRPVVWQGVVTAEFHYGWVGLLHGIDTTTGKEIWRADSNHGSPALSEGVIYGVGVWQSNVSALDALSGRSLWSLDFEGDADFPPAVSDGVLYFGTYQGLVYAVK